jgi:hypothetical protein
MMGKVKMWGSGRVGGLAALGLVAVLVLPNVVLVPAGLPRSGADPGEVAAFFATAGDVVGITAMFGPVVWLLAVLFGAGAVAALRASGVAGTEHWALAGFAGVLLQNATFTAVVATRLALVTTEGEGAAVLWALHDALFGLNGTFLATAMLGLSMAGLRAGLLRRWHGVLGFCAATLQFSSAVLTPLIIGEGSALGLLGLVGWLLWVVWIACYGVVLLRLSGEQDQLAGRAVG